MIVRRQTGKCKANGMSRNAPKCYKILVYCRSQEVALINQWQLSDEKNKLESVFTPNGKQL